MKIKLDENIPSRLASFLRNEGHDADSVADEGLTGYDDSAVAEAANSAGRFLMTQDLDFSDIRRFVPGTHPGILVVRLQAPGRQALHDRIVALLRDESLDEWEGCVVIATEMKVRVRRPDTPPPRGAPMP